MNSNPVSSIPGSTLTDDEANFVHNSLGTSNVQLTSALVVAPHDQFQTIKFPPMIRSLPQHGNTVQLGDQNMCIICPISSLDPLIEKFITWFNNRGIQIDVIEVVQAVQEVQEVQ